MKNSYICYIIAIVFWAISVTITFVYNTFWSLIPNLIGWIFYLRGVVFRVQSNHKQETEANKE
jgi:hypothetical protein